MLKERDKLEELIKDVAYDFRFAADYLAIDDNRKKVLQELGKQTYKEIEAKRLNPDTAKDDLRKANSIFAKDFFDGLWDLSYKMEEVSESEDLAYDNATKRLSILCREFEESMIHKIEKEIEDASVKYACHRTLYELMRHIYEKARI